MAEPKEGDRVSVDLSDVYLGICSRCGQVTLMVPGGSCAPCGAPESAVAADPMISSEDIWSGADPVQWND